jgi:hypothetical protein
MPISARISATDATLHRADAVFHDRSGLQPALPWCERRTTSPLSSRASRGETGAEFRLRLHQHLCQQLAGMYHIYEPELFAVGQKRALWRGLYGNDREAGLAAFVECLPSLAPALANFVRGCLKTCQTSQATHHEMDHRDTDHGFTRLSDILIIL